MTNAEKLAELARQLETDKWHTVALEGGVTVRARLEYDTDTRLEDNGDWFGSIHWPERDSRARPGACNGAARKIDTRGGSVWWQPPADVVGDADALKKLETRVRDYFLEYWCYVGVIVQVLHAPCACCGERKKTSASLWGIESDAGEYFAEVLSDLVAGAMPTTV